MQNLPDQPTKAMGNRPDGLWVPQARYQTAIHNLEDASFDLDRGVGTLIENASHLAVTLRGSITLGYPRALFFSRPYSHPRGEVLLRRKCRGAGTHFGNDLVRRIYPKPGTSASR